MLKTVNARMEVARGLLANRPVTGLDGEPFFAKDTFGLFVYDELTSSWQAVSGGSTVLFQVEGSDLAVQNKVNFTGDPSNGLVIGEDDDGAVHWSASGLVSNVNSFTSNLVNIEQIARISGDANLGAGLTAESSARGIADAVLAASITSHIVSFQIDGTPNASQTVLNFTSDGLLGIEDVGGGEVRFNSGPVINQAVSTAGDYTDSVVGSLVLPATKTPVSHQWLASYDAATGLFTQSQPAYSDISGTPTLAATKAPTSHKWLASYDASTGLFTQTQPDYADLTNTPTLAQTKAAASTKFLSAYDASTGLFTNAQPAFSDLSGSASVGQIPNLPASQITSGQIALARGGSNADLSGTGGTSQVLKQVSVGAAITVGQLSFSDLSGSAVVGQIPNLPASQITSGQIALARGGTNADLSATGGTSQVLKQTSLGGAITVATVNFSDLAGSIAAGQIASGTVTWDTLGAAGADLTLANTSRATTFTQTSGVTWTWKNTTAATSSANNSSPILKLTSDMWSNGADTLSGYAIQSIVSASPNSKSITNSSENSSSLSVLTVGSSHGFVVGNRVTFSGLTTMTWLNGTTCIVLVVAATTISVTDPTTHGTSASHADTGTCTLVPPMELTFTPSGTAGDTRLMIPFLGAANANVGAGGFAFVGQSAFIGYGPLSTSLGGFAIYTPGGSSSIACINLYRTSPAPSAISATQAIAGWEFGDNSGGNSTSSISTLVANFSAGLNGSLTTGTSNPCVYVGAGGGGVGNLVATSGTQIGFGIGFGKAVTNSFNFAPGSGSANFVACQINATINNSAASGSYQMLKIQAIETALGNSGNTLIDLYAGSAGTTRLWSISNSGGETTYTPNGAQWTCDSVTEQLTLNTGSLTTDTSGNLLPANSIIEAVVCRITTALTTTTNWAVGDSGTANRFSSANSTLALGTTSIGLNHWSGASGTLANGPSQPSSAKVRITCTGSNPGAGVIRITVFYRTFIAPSS